jgi:hypothetical protein
MYETGQWPKDFSAVRIIAEDLMLLAKEDTEGVTEWK